MEETWLPLPGGKRTLIDPEDYPWLSQFRWHTTAGGRYVARNVHGGKTRVRYAYLHREIMGVTDRSVQVDHVNGDPLDNRRANLRTCSQSLNMGNTWGQRRRRSRFKGVHWRADLGKWQAEIQFEKKRQWLGVFVTEEAAARAYDRAARTVFGGFARPSLPLEVPTMT